MISSFKPRMETTATLNHKILFQLTNEFQQQFLFVDKEETKRTNVSSCFRLGWKLFKRRSTKNQKRKHEMWL